MKNPPENANLSEARVLPNGYIVTPAKDGKGFYLGRRADDDGMAEQIIADAILEKIPEFHAPSLMAWHIHRRLKDAGLHITRTQKSPPTPEG